MPIADYIHGPTIPEKEYPSKTSLNMRAEGYDLTIDACVGVYKKAVSKSEDAELKELQLLHDFESLQSLETDAVFGCAIQRYADKQIKKTNKANWWRTAIFTTAAVALTVAFKGCNSNGQAATVKSPTAQTQIHVK